MGGTKGDIDGWSNVLAPVEPLTIDIYIIACDTNTMLNINSSLWKRSMVLKQVSTGLCNLVRQWNVNMNGN